MIRFEGTRICNAYRPLNTVFQHQFHQFATLFRSQVQSIVFFLGIRYNIWFLHWYWNFALISTGSSLTTFYIGITNPVFIVLHEVGPCRQWNNQTGNNFGCFTTAQLLWPPYRMDRLTRHTFPYLAVSICLRLPWATDMWGLLMDVDRSGLERKAIRVQRMEMTVWTVTSTTNANILHVQI
jgi:hypothetical protein